MAVSIRTTPKLDELLVRLERGISFISGIRKKTGENIASAQRFLTAGQPDKALESMNNAIETLNETIKLREQEKNLLLELEQEEKEEQKISGLIKKGVISPEEFVELFKLTGSGESAGALERFRNISLNLSIHHAGIRARVIAVRIDAVALEGFTFMGQSLPIQINVKEISHSFEEKVAIEKYRKPLLDAEEILRKAKPFGITTMEELARQIVEKKVSFEDLKLWGYTKEEYNAILALSAWEKEERKTIESMPRFSQQPFREQAGEGIHKVM
ncbi:MAG TPA: hypothetical protein VJI75_03090 [Candidatus Nanoarchaeia archaeon]|nr:hypothetical protein [Candidatus Nanoarchaeia archaeon]